MSALAVHIVAVIFPEFELLDLYGPLELFGMMKERITITVAAEKPGIVVSNQGPKVIADAAISEVESADVLLVPGGWGTRKEIQNESFLNSLRKLSAKSKYTTSVCTGSAILAKAGLLDGRRATSNKRAFTWVTSQSNNVSWVRKARWVEDGHLFTSSGVSAGMDMTLALIERLFDLDSALKAAARAEYTWHQDSTFDLFADADDLPV
jgi:putative intracellular protease/amidase